jgi:hypothetical protein
MRFRYVQKVARLRNHHDYRTRLVTLPDAKRLTGRKEFPTHSGKKRNKQLNFSKISKTVLPALALLLATGAFAANKQNKGSLELDQPATIGGHQLASGEYKLTWDGTGPNVDLMIKSYGKLVATVPAHLIELSRPERSNTYVAQTNADGSQSLIEIDFGGKKYALAFGDGATMTESASQSSSQ